MLNPFASNDAYNSVNLTEAFNVFPLRYGNLTASGLFGAPRGITTRTALVENYNGVLTLLPTKQVGEEPNVGKTGTREARTFLVPHIPLVDVVLPEEVAGVRAFGSESELEPLNRLIARKLDENAAKFDATLEHLLWGALKGIVYDADGSTVLFNYFTEFGVSQNTLDWVLDSSGTEVLAKVMATKRLVDDAVGAGDMISGYECRCSEEFFDALVTHATVKEAYKYSQANVQMRTDSRNGFDFAGVRFIEERGKVGAIRYVPANKAYFYPLGTRQTFRLFAAPANMNEFVNTEGRLRYAKQEPRKFDRGTDLWMESNPLPICLRPKAVVEVSI